MYTVCRRSNKVGIVPTPPDAETWCRGYEIAGGLRCGVCRRYDAVRFPKTPSEVFEEAFLRTIGRNYAVVDPEGPQQVAHDAAELSYIAPVLLGRQFDPWCPAGQKYRLGRRYMEAILEQQNWRLEIWTKNAGVLNDFDILKKYRHRVRIGVILTAPASTTSAMDVLEPHACSNPERMGVLWQAHKEGLATLAVLGPLLPGIADSESQIDELVGFAAECGAEWILAKPINGQRLALGRLQRTLAKAGHAREADAIECIKTRKGWSQYATEMACNFQRSCLKLYELGRLHFFLKPSQLEEDDISRLEINTHGIDWIGEKRQRPAGLESYWKGRSK